jgi:hypothetical protein
MAKTAKTAEFKISLGSESKSIEIDRQSILNNPNHAIEQIGGEIQGFVLDYADKEREKGSDDPMEGYEPKIEVGPTTSVKPGDKRAANNTDAG